MLSFKQQTKIKHDAENAIGGLIVPFELNSILKALRNNPMDRDILASAQISYSSFHHKALDRMTDILGPFTGNPDDADIEDLINYYIELPSDELSDEDKVYVDTILYRWYSAFKLYEAIVNEFDM